MLARSAFQPRRKNSGRQNDGKRFPKHLRWLRSLPCALEGRHECWGIIEAAHDDKDPLKGMGVKGPDYNALPLCSGGHRELHNGYDTFEETYGVVITDLCRQYAANSPHRRDWENPRNA